MAYPTIVCPMTFLPANSIASLSVTIAQGHFHKWQGVVMIRYSTIEDRVWHLCGTARAPGGQQPSTPAHPRAQTSFCKTNCQLYLLSHSSGARISKVGRSVKCYQNIYTQMKISSTDNGTGGGQSTTVPLFIICIQLCFYDFVGRGLPRRLPAVVRTPDIYEIMAVSKALNRGQRLVAGKQWTEAENISPARRTLSSSPLARRVGVGC